MADLPSTPMTRQYPGIAQACFLIALDNGGINRDRSTRKWANDFTRWLQRRGEPLVDIEAWLSKLDEEQMETVCAGEATEVDAMLADAPPFTQLLLNEYFDPGPC